MTELWKDIDGFEGKYQVSSWGRVRNLNTNKILTPYENSKGYLKVGLHLKGHKSPVKKRVNRLVAIAFIPNPYELPQVNHKDGNKQNNSISNLEWCTNRQNAIHRRKMEMWARALGY